MQFLLSTFTEDKNKIKKRITSTSMILSLPKHNFHSKKKKIRANMVLHVNPNIKGTKGGRSL